MPPLCPRLPPSVEPMVQQFPRSAARDPAVPATVLPKRRAYVSAIPDDIDGPCPRCAPRASSQCFGSSPRVVCLCRRLCPRLCPPSVEPMVCKVARSVARDPLCPLLCIGRLHYEHYFTAPKDKLLRISLRGKGRPLRHTWANEDL